MKIDEFDKQLRDVKSFKDKVTKELDNVPRIIARLEENRMVAIGRLTG